MIYSLQARPTWLLSTGPRIAVDTEIFVELSASREVEALERAAALYRDEFLAGLHVPVDPFSHWLAAERQRWSTLRLHLQSRLSLAQAEAGRLEEAAASARLVTELDPLSEPGHRLLMQLLARSGQRAAALQQYERCREILQQELGVAPEAETAQLVDAIRSGALAPETAASPGADVQGPATDPVPPAKPSIVVLPFANLSGDRGRDYFVEGLVEDITVAPGRESWLFVIAGPSAQAALVNGDDLPAIAARLGIRYVLKGSVRIDGDDVIFVAQLADAAGGVQLWSERFQDRLDNVFALQERLTTKVAAMIAPARKSAEVDRAQHKPTKSPTAYDLYPIRPCTMHARLITQDDELLLQVEVPRWLKAIGISI